MLEGLFHIDGTLGSCSDVHDLEMPKANAAADQLRYREENLPKME